jgi:hypothetical protein
MYLEMLSWIEELKSTTIESQSHSSPERLLLEGGQSACMSDTLSRLFATTGPTVR